MFFDENDEERKDCTCGKDIEECDFYEATTRHMRFSDAVGWNKQLFVQVPKFSSVPILDRFLHSARFESSMRHQLIEATPAYRSIRDRFLTAQLQFFANARKLTDASIYLDGTKSIRRAQLFARDNHSEMKVLHLIRDGRGFCASYVKHTHPTPTLGEAASAWVRYIARVDGFTTQFPTVPAHVVRYEDLCRSTSEAIRSICQFLQIPYEEPHPHIMNEAHILGNRMRRAFTGVIVEDTSWREKLDQPTRTKLTSLMRRELERFGYL